MTINTLQQLSQKIKLWVEKNKFEFALLLFILLFALVLRVWKIDQYLPFLGDEGRDVRVVRRFITHFDLMFIGPRTSIGDMYLGPLYYYLISPFLFLWNFSPVGPAVFVSLTSVVTVFLIWHTVREWFGKYGAMASAFLYAISPIIILNARHSWNPNIMPFLALLSIYSIWKVWEKREFKWLLVIGASFGAIIQSHYLGLLIAPTIAIFWAATLYKLSKSNSKKVRPFIYYTSGALIIFLILMFPLFLFDWKHGWQNTIALKTFFFNRQSTVSAKPWNAIPQLWPLWQEQIVIRLLTAKNSQVGTVIGAIFVLVSSYYGYLYYKVKNWDKLDVLSLLALWGVVGLLGIGLLKQAIYDHYFGFLFPLPFILFGFLFEEFLKRKLKIIAVIILTILIVINFKANPLFDPPQNQLKRVQDIDQNIISDSQNKPFNFALIAKQNYEEGYLYYFEMWKAQVREINPQDIPGTLSDQLYVVCEDPVCEPINNAKAEVANFGWAKIDRQWEVDGTKVFRLVHSK